MYKISVIIPVYNTEKYIDKCLKSVLNQTLKDIEIIVINDGSTDKSGEILKKYKVHDNIVIIDKANEGQGIARNEAIRIARGDYLAFVDSDDYIEKDMLEKMYLKAIKDSLDIVICNYKYVYDNSNEILSSNIILDDNEIINSKECLKRFFTKNTIEGFSCNKLLKKTIFIENNIKYPKIKYEDIPTMANIIICSERIGFINNKFYNYLLRKDSTTATKTLSNSKDYLKAIFMVKESILNKKINLKSEMFYYYYFRIINEVYDMFKLYRNNKEFQKFIKKFLWEEKLSKAFYRILINNNFRFNLKVKLLLKIILIRINIFFL